MKCTTGSKSCGQSLVSSPDCPSQVHCLPIVVFLLERHATRNTFSVDPMCILSRPQIHHPRFFPSTHSPGPRHRTLAPASLDSSVLSHRLAVQSSHPAPMSASSPSLTPLTSVQSLARRCRTAPRALLRPGYPLAPSTL
jgi:hypothetical protein